ncbi:MAG TPA: translocation/assembly module TamB domain-containing protein [Longimicrobiales bacterium]
MALPRREIPILFGGFAGGMLIAFALVFAWVSLTGGTEQAFALNAPVDPHRANDSSGLIGYTYGRIANRMNSERRVVRKSRGDLSFRATRITWQDARRPDFARVGELRGVINASTASSGNIVVRAAVISNADIYVEQAQTRGEWNYQRVIARMRGPDDGGPKKLFVVNDLAVRNTRVRVNTPDRDFVINNLAAQLPRVDLSGPNLDAPRAHVARATGVLAINNETHAVAVTDARLRFPAATEFTIASVTMGETRLSSLAGTFGGDIPGVGLRATGRAENVRFEDIRFISPRLPASGVAAFSFDVDPLSATRTRVVLTDGSVRTQGSNVRGSATVIVGDSKSELVAVDARFDPLDLALLEQLLGDTLPYQGTITGTARGSGGLINFDVNTRLVSADVRTPFATHLTGSAFFSEAGFELRRLDADMREVPLLALRAVLPGLPLSGTVSGRVSLAGSPDNAPLNLNVRLELALGVAILEGTVDLRGAEPAYDLTGRLLAVNLNELIEPNVPPVFVSARFTLNGRGSSTETMQARVDLHGRFTGWRAAPQDSIHAAFGIRNGTVTIDTAIVRLASMNARASGSWRFLAPSSGAIGYQVAFEPITPFAPFFPAIGDEDAAGNLRLSGTASGQTGRIVFNGEATGSGLKVGQWGAGALDSKYQLVIGPAVPEIQFNASARELQTPTAGAYTTATAQLELISPRFSLDVKADRVGTGGLEIFADGRIPPTGAREVILHRARLELGEEQWALLNPAVFNWSSERNAPVNIRNLDFREVDGNGRVLIDGRIRPPASADFRIETVSFPVDELQRLLGRQPVVAGELGLNATVRVTQGVPQITGKFQLDSAVVQNVRFSALTGDINYANDRLITTATAVVDTAGQLNLRAELPLDMRFGDSMVVRMRDTGPVNITLVSDSIALAPFAVLSPEVEDVTGKLTANLSVTGTVQAPVLSGTFAVRNARAHIVRANTTYDSINAVVALQGQRAVIEQAVARSDGLVTATGSIEFADLNRPVFDITGNLTDFRAAGVEGQTAAQVNGQVRLTGPMDGATLTGDVELSDGYFPVPTVFSSPLDDELTELALPGGAPDPNAAAPSRFVENLRIDDFRVRAGESLWFSMPDARAQLEGELVFDKSGEDIRITGTLTGTRGQYTLRAGPIVRRFDVVEVEVRFLGDTEINPLINIVASRLIVDPAGRQIDIRVRVGGTMRAPTLALASADAANIPQSELLSFLLFGQSNIGLTGGGLVPGQALVAETFWGGFTELIGLELEDELADAGVSFDIFQLRFGNRIASLTEPTIVLGEEISDNLFLTVESALGVLGGGGGLEFPTVRLEWRRSPSTTLRLGYELVNLNRALRSVTVAQPIGQARQDRQVTFDFTKRWSW